MSNRKKFLISAGWVVIVSVGVMLFEQLRQVGTTWTGNPGFFRLIALSVFGLTCAVAPLFLSALTWLGQPASFYKRFR